MKKPARAAAASKQQSRARTAAPAYWAAAEAFLERRAVWLVLALVLLGTIRIVSTYSIFSYTFDEPAHLAAGMEWIEKHTYTYETQHPPLARVMTAVLPKLSGAHGANRRGMWDEGLAILGADGKLDSTLALARAGILPFFWITCWVVFAVTRWISKRSTEAVLAVFLATMTPALLAHGGLATTDMALTATLLAAIYTCWRWMAEPSWTRAGIAGAALGLAVMAKFSTLAFFPSAVVVALIIWWIRERRSLDRPAHFLRPRAVQALLLGAVAALVIWAGYRFSFGQTAMFSFRVPAPELFSGIEEVRKHNASGHLTYLMGAVNTVGWPYFYVVALGVKTPLPILALGLAGLVLLFSRKPFSTRGWMVPSTVLGILIFSSFFTQIKIGTRHVLPVIVMFAVAGGCAAAWTLRRYEGRRLPQSLLALTLLSVPAVSLAAHPDYLAYFNLLAGDRPEAFLVDSDLDWSQDVKRLAARLKQVGAQEVYFNQYAPGDLPNLYGFPPIKPLDVNGPLPGWNAVSLTPMKYGLFHGDRYIPDPGVKFWPESFQPVERIGGLLLIYSPPGQ